MKVNEIFQSIDGEGLRTGALTTFIRLCGCNLRCSYCDTLYAMSTTVDNINCHELTVDEIVQRVDSISISKYVTVTGGEPLIHRDVYKLFRALIKRGYEVNVETNGSICPQAVSVPGELFYTMDFKCPSSGVMSQMNDDALESLSLCDALKFVVGSLEDLETARSVIHHFNPQCAIFLSPVFGKITPVQIVEYMQAHKMSECRIQLQLHKLIWDPNKRGV